MSSGGITSLNGLTDASQTFAVGTAGAGFSISSAGGVHTFNIPNASASAKGLLTAVDWSTFNNKQNALTNPVTGTGVSGQVAYWNGTTTQTGNNNLFWDGTNERLGIGTTTPAYPLDVVSTGAAINGRVVSNNNTGQLDSVFVVQNSATIAANVTVGIRLVCGPTINGGSDRGYFFRSIIGPASNPILDIYSVITGTSTTLQRFFGNTGNISINNSNDAGYKFDVTGTLRSTADAYFATASGNVGIGTTTPSGLFHARISANAQLIFQNSSQNNLYLSGDNATLNIDATNGTLFPGIFIRLGGTAYGQLTSGTFGTQLISFQNTPTTFVNGATERMRITSTGVVVIGNGQSNASPSLGLIEATDGSGTDIAGAEFRIQGGQSTGTGAGGPVTFYTSPTGTTGTATNAAVERMRVTSIGNVGIGTALPSLVTTGRKSLVIRGTTAEMLLQSSNTTDGGALGVAVVGGGNDMSFVNRLAGNFSFFTNSVEVFRIHGNGRLTVNTVTDAGYQFDVSGTLRSTASSYFATGSGGVGIGTTSITGSTKLEVVQTQDGNGSVNGFIVRDSTDIQANFTLQGGTSSGTQRIIISSLSSSQAAPIGNTGVIQSSDGTLNNYFPLRFLASTVDFEISTSNYGARLTVVRVNSSGLGIGQTTFGTSATKTLAVGTGVAPTTSPADAFQMYSADVVAGNAAPHIRTENGAVVKVYQETTGVGNAAFVQGSVNAVYEDSTFDGYTLKQIVKALRNQGLLA